MNGLPPRTEMERAYLERDPNYNGVFVLGVRTTAIFCRPTCPARKPLTKNVEFFSTPRAALFAGYRPCKRCRPMALDDQPEWAAALLADIEKSPHQRVTDADLKCRGIDPATVRRHFQRHYGMTFQAYSRARRLSGARHSIREGTPIDTAAFDTGYESHSGFRDAFTRLVGTTPGASRTNHHTGVWLGWLRSPLGPLIAGATDEGLCLLEFSDRRMIEAQLATVRKLFDGPILPGAHEHLTTLDSELTAYFAGALRQFSVPLVYPGTPFQRRVWDELLVIPYGETRSYQQLAVAIGDVKAVRAVGRTNGLNRIAIVIPCHRVVNKSGALGGYGGGLRRKQFLLDLERASIGANSEGSRYPLFESSSA